MIDFDKLHQDDDFIKWVSGKESTKETYWNSLLNDLKEEEKNKFIQSIDFIKRITSVNVEENFQKRDSYYIESKLSKLHIEAKSLKKSKTIILKQVLKYAATIIILIGLGVIINNLTSNNNIFKDHLEATDFDKNKIQIKTEKGIYYTIDHVNKSWVTKNGVKINLSNNLFQITKTNEHTSTSHQGYTIIVPFKKQFEIGLIDGTKVNLNANTQFTFSLFSNKNKREVTLIGEAYFDVAHNKNKPFKVCTNSMNLEVLGTKFNITNYPNELNVKTTLLDGKIKIDNKLGKYKILQPNELAIINKEVNEIIIKNVNVNDAIIWTTDIMQLKNHNLEFITEQLSRWYGVEFEFENIKIGSLTYSGSLRKDMTLEDILSKLNYSNNINFSIKDKKIKLYFNGSNN